MFHFRVKMSQTAWERIAQTKSFPLWEHTLEKPLLCNLPLHHQIAYLNQLVSQVCIITNMEHSDQSFSQDDRWDFQLDSLFIV